MPYKFFQVAVRDSSADEIALNTFLGCHRILSVDRRWVDQGQDSFWSFCIDYHDPSSGTNPSRGSKSKSKDYKELLDPDDFAVFAQLRDLRKEIAQAEAVPVYTIFSNEQLAQMAQSKTRSKADMEKIAGVGDARIAKYGQRFLELLNQAVKAHDETSGESV